MMDRFTNRVLRAKSSLMVCMALLLLTGCIRNLEDTAIPGEYHSTGSWGESSLVLSEHGTFQQSLRIVGAKKVKISGAWHMLDKKEKSSRRSIGFSPFLSMNEETLGDFEENASYDIRSAGISSVQIETDDEAGIHYKKIKAGMTADLP
jgi:hypothetical protein